MLENFLCSLRKARGQEVSSGVVVVTPPVDGSVVELSNRLDVGIFSASLSIEIDGCFDLSNSSNLSHDFGTLCYQQLILMRTTTVMYLLLLGFSPLVADIDAVWKTDALARLHELVPLSSPHGSTGYDVAATLDHGEICGCFVYLTPSSRAVAFWAQVTDMHHDQVRRAKIDGLANFFDSEQKILTKIILEMDCNNQSFTVVILPADMFPSGQVYFNEWSGDDRAKNSTIVIHNNFIIGNDMKRLRFKAIGQWVTANSTCTLEVDNVRNQWNKLFADVKFDDAVQTFAQYMPVHNSVYIATDITIIQGGIEGFPAAERSVAVSLSSDPPSTFEFNTFMLYEVSIANASPLSSFGMAMKDSKNTGVARHLIERGLVSDFGVDNNVFSVDRKGKYHSEADLNAVQFFSDPAEHTTSVSEISMAVKANKYQQSNLFKGPCAEIIIKVLTYNRPESLKRLLKSLCKLEIAQVCSPVSHLCVYL